MSRFYLLPFATHLIALGLLGAFLGGCQSQDETPSKGEATASGFIALSNEAALNRVTLALTGMRPSVEELAELSADSDALNAIARRYVETPEFGITVKDMYAEILLMRSPRLTLPSIGPLDGQDSISVRNALAEEPLDLIREVVMSNRPLTEIVTANWTMIDDVSSQIWSGFDYDESLGGLQKVDLTDERPAAGILSTGSFLMRHESNGANYHRGRASVITDAFLCEPFGGRDIPITGDVDLSDDVAVADALNSNPQCVACHQIVDPMAQHFWGFRSRLTANQVARGYTDEGNCAFRTPCYPIPTFAELVRGDGAKPWTVLGLRAPNYWGAETRSLSDMGSKMAADPRFAKCAVERFAAYFAQMGREQLDPDFVGRLQKEFIDSDFDAKHLALSIVTDEWFLSRGKLAETTLDIPGPQLLRPEQFERFIRQLTGFELKYFIQQSNYGTARTLVDDLVGFRAMAGGIDGDLVTKPVHTFTPVRLLVYSMYAQEAAGFIVTSDLEDTSGQPRLLTQVTAVDTGEEAVRNQLVDLIAKIYGRVVPETNPDVDSLYLLWSSVRNDSNELVIEAWKAVLTAMFQSPDALIY